MNTTKTIHQRHTIIFTNIFIFTICFILPFIYLNNTIDPTLNIRFFILSILNFIIFSYFALTRSSELKILFNNKLIIGFLLFLFWLIITSFFANNIHESIYEIIKYFNLILLLIIASSLFRNIDFYDKLIKSFTLSSFLLSIIGILQFVFKSTFIPGGWGFPYATMANANLYAMALFLLIPYLLYSIITYNNQWKIFSILSLFLLQINLILTQTRSVFIAIIISILLIIPFCKYFKIRLGISRYYTYSLLIILFFYVTMFITYNKKPITTSNDDFENQYTYISINERINLASKTVNIFNNHPLIGCGIGNWKINFPIQGTGEMVGENGYTLYKRPHNDYLLILSETGFIGFLIYITLLILAINYCIKILNKKNNLENKKLIITLLFGLFGYSIISLFSFPIERTFHSIMFILYLSGIISLFINNSDKENYLNINIKSIYVLISVISFFSIFFLYARLEAEKSQKEILTLRKEGKWKEIVNRYDENNIFYYSLGPSTMPTIWYRGVAHYQSENYSLALEDFTTAYALHPNNPHVLNNLGSIYEYYGDHNKSIEYYKRAIQVAEKFEDALINLSIVYYNAGNFESSYKILNKKDVYFKNNRHEILLKEVEKKINE